MGPIRGSYMALSQFFSTYQVDGLEQDCCISSANALEILQSWTKPSKWGFNQIVDILQWNFQLHFLEDIYQIWIQNSHHTVAWNIWLNYQGQRPEFRKRLWRVWAPLTNHTVVPWAMTWITGSADDIAPKWQQANYLYQCYDLITDVYMWNQVLTS